MYSLTDDEEDEEEGDGAGHSGAADPLGQGAWAAELGLLALHACVALAPQVH